MHAVPAIEKSRRPERRYKKTNQACIDFFRRFS